MTLEPGDVILCGTSIGVGSMKPGSMVEVEIDGIGTLAQPLWLKHREQDTTTGVWT